MAAVAAALRLVPHGGVGGRAGRRLLRHPGQLLDLREAAGGRRCARVDLADTDGRADGRSTAPTWSGSSRRPTRCSRSPTSPPCCAAAHERRARSWSSTTPSPPRCCSARSSSAPTSSCTALTKYLSGHSDVVLGAAVTPTTDAGRARTSGCRGTAPCTARSPGRRGLARAARAAHPAPAGRARAGQRRRAGRAAAPPTRRSTRVPLPGPRARCVVDRARRRRRRRPSGSLRGDPAVGARDQPRRGRVAARAAAAWPGECATVPEALLRLSVGIEDVEDLWATCAALDPAPREPSSRSAGRRPCGLARPATAAPQRSRRAGALVDDRDDLLGDRHLDAVLRARSRTDSQDFTPSAVCLVAATPPRGHAPAEVARRRCGCATAATCRWRPGRRCRRARRRSAGRRPAPAPSRVVSASPRVMSEALVLSPSPMPLGHADGERDDVLHRAAELAADHVGVGVGPEVRRRRRPAAAARRRPRRRRRRRCAAGCRSAISRARLGPDTTATRSGATPADLGDDLAHPLGRAELDALHQADQHGGRAAAAGPTRRGCRAASATGTASTTTSAPSAASAGSVVAADRSGSAMPGR